MRPGSIVGGVVLAAVVLALIVLAAAGRLVVDALWFEHLGYFVVFRTSLTARVICFLVAFAVALPVIFAVGVAALEEKRTGPVRIVLRRGNGELTIPELIAPVAARLPWKTLIAVAAALISVLFALGQAAGWETWWRWRNAVAFGETDPIFGRDIAFYLFTLPALQRLAGSALALAVLAGLVAAIVLWVQGALDLRRPAAPLPERALRLLSIVLALVFLAKAGDYWLGRYELLLQPSGAVHGAGHTAVAVRLPFQWILALLSLVAAGLCAANVPRAGWRLLVASVVGVMTTSILASVVPDFYQRLRVRPDELRIERPYLEHNIRMTRLAYGLDRLKPRPFPAAGTLDESAIERNRETFGNVRLWDPKPLLESYRQLQVIRLYYEFHDVDVDRYDLEGRYRQVMLGAREIDAEQLPENARTWVNQRLQFTHGFGAVMSPVTEFEGEGLPKFFLKDIPPRSTAGIEITEPRIYFGERSNEYVIVNTSAAEFDYPKGNENVYAAYAGRGGLPIGSWFRRVLFAWVFRDLNLLISPTLQSESRVLFRRSVQERIATLAPFLRLDNDPYLVVSEGRLYWIQDAYTTSGSFPYSEPVRGLNLSYIRNSVKVVLDAYHGTVEFYAAEPNEPVLSTYRRMFPEMFRPIEEMPEDLRRHVRYPENLFLIQAEMYRTYHMTSPDVFYNKEDLWNFPSETVEGRHTTVEPYYVIMKLPEEKKAELVLMQPMTPSNRNNMVAWLAARCDGESYGGLVEYQFPKERLLYGPQQIEARIDQDTVISQQLSLWNQMGSRVIRGNLLVIPVEDSIVYVEPLYLRSEQGQIPELKRVIAAYGDRVAMEPSLDAALRAVLSGARVPSAPRIAPSGPPAAAGEAAAIAPTLQAARERYRAALESLRRGDWSAFGREMDALGRSLGEEEPAGQRKPTDTR